MRIIWLTEDFQGVKNFFDGKVDYDQGMPAQYNPLVYIANKGHKIDIVYPGKKDTLEKDIWKNITSSSFKKPKHNSIFNFGIKDFRLCFIINIFKSFFLALKLVKKYKYDLIYCHWEFQSVVGRILTFLIKKPFVIRMYGSTLYGRTSGDLSTSNILLNLNRYIPFKLNCEKMILTQDGTGGEKIYSRINKNDEKLEVLLNGVNWSKDIIDYSQKFKLPSNSFIITYVGRLDSWKRTHLFTDTLEEVKKYIPNVMYLIIGDGPNLKSEKKKATDRNLNESIYFSGQVSQNERKFLMSKSNIYVSMYAYSNLSNTFLEAISIGLPTLIIPNGSTKFLAEEGVNCLFIQEKNASQDLVEKIKYLYDNVEKREELARSSKINAKSKLLSWDERSEIELNILKDIVNKIN